MDDTFAAELKKAVMSGLHQAVKEKLTGYSSPLEKLLGQVIDSQAAGLRQLLVECVSGTLGDAEFREQIRVAVRSKLAKTLIERFGGELEKQVNTLKSDPATRARIVLAIEEIVKTPAG